jgi:hypothetical protein
VILASCLRAVDAGELMQWPGAHFLVMVPCFFFRDWGNHNLRVQAVAGGSGSAGLVGSDVRYASIWAKSLRTWMTTWPCARACWRRRLQTRNDSAENRQKRDGLAPIPTPPNKRAS